ncbi:hypothetical protein D3C84_604660 [compost metagenome]
MPGQRRSDDPPAHEEQQHGDQQQGFTQQGQGEGLAEAAAGDGAEQAEAGDDRGDDLVAPFLRGAEKARHHLPGQPGAEQRGAQQCQPGSRPEQESEARQ